MPHDCRRELLCFDSSCTLPATADGVQLLSEFLYHGTSPFRAEEARMLDVLKRLRERASDRATTVVCECRRCGLSLDSETDQCPHCGPTGVACYEFE